MVTYWHVDFSFHGLDNKTSLLALLSECGAFLTVSNTTRRIESKPSDKWTYNAVGNLTPGQLTRVIAELSSYGIESCYRFAMQPHS